MYRWQSLTMARVEFWLGKGESHQAIIDTVKAFILKINQPHFPEPSVRYYDEEGFPAVDLTFEVDNRAAVFPFVGKGVLLRNYWSRRFLVTDGEPIEAAMWTTEDVMNFQAIHWLLFGSYAANEVVREVVLKIPKLGSGADRFSAFREREETSRGDRQCNVN